MTRTTNNVDVCARFVLQCCFIVEGHNDAKHTAILKCATPMLSIFLEKRKLIQGYIYADK